MAETKKTADKATAPSDFFLANRETVESIAVAVILALLFRAFIAEAFVIPTGSMAPTLMGRHVDVWCDECKYHYQASASIERDSTSDNLTGELVVDCRCPNCGFRKPLDRSTWFSNENSMSGDRIIVSKFAYELGEPQRWDVIVFKYPVRAQINFIKRLIGLPGETVLLSGGNIYVKREEESEFRIARKDDDSKLLTLLQVVHDSDYPAPKLEQAGWPPRWQPHASGTAWQSDEHGTTYTLSSTSTEAWLRYHHVDPASNSPAPNDSFATRDESDWARALRGREVVLQDDWQGRLISDFYAYNCSRSINPTRSDFSPDFRDNRSGAFGNYWVDDLAVECEVELKEATGEIALDLVRAGGHYTCRIDATTGKATLSIRGGDGKEIPFENDGKSIPSLTAQTTLKGAGSYRVRLSNVDHEMRLWVNSSRIKFDSPATYASPRLVLPDIASDDGDLAPVGIGGRGQAFTVRHLRVLRDKYYIAGDETDEYGPHSPGMVRITEILSHPNESSIQELLSMRNERQFKLEADQFLPLGDNSPASSDARYWDTHYVDRKLLVGKALFIYWPHTWYVPPYLPDFRRMQPIH
jgi:signal peptidase I